MKDKFCFEVNEGDIVAVSSFDNYENYFFEKLSILEIDNRNNEWYAKVNYGEGVWVSENEIILIQRC